MEGIWLSLEYQGSLLGTQSLSWVLSQGGRAGRAFQEEKLQGIKGTRAVIFQQLAGAKRGKQDGERPNLKENVITCSSSEFTLKAHTRVLDGYLTVQFRDTEPGSTPPIPQ